MSTQFFVDAEGRFIGGFGDGAVPPEGAVEVMVAPPSGAAIWTDGAWVEPVPVPEVISFAQMMAGLVDRKWITRAEQRAWLAGTPPANVVALIDAMPAHLIDITYARATKASEVRRRDPSVGLLAALVPNVTEADLDEFFRDCAAL